MDRCFIQSILAAGVAIAAIAAILPSPVRAGEKPPNVVFILADDLGYGDLGCQGHPRIQTPRLDRLAERGVRLTQYYVTSPVCTPTRASFMTGRHPQRFDIHHADLPERTPRYPLPSEAVTLPEILQQAGYRTEHFGKWHLGEPPEAPMPRGHGFDYFFGGMGGRPSSSWMKHARSDNPQFIENEDAARTVEGHVTDITTDRVLERLTRAAEADQPFYFNVWYNAPHEPLTPKVDEMALYEADADLDERQKVYYAAVSNLDKNIGRILDRLSELGIERETFVFFTSDNGPETHTGRYSAGSALPLRGIKTQLWEGGIRVPAIAAWPGVLPEGRVCDAVGSALDFFPTVCSLAGVEGWRDLPRDEGIDFLPHLTGQFEPVERTLFFEFHSGQRKGPTPANEYGGPEPSGQLVMRKGDWKIHLTPGGEMRRLYNLREDVAETADLSKSHPALLAQLEAEAWAWYSSLPREDGVQHQSHTPPDSEEVANRIHLPSTN